MRRCEFCNITVDSLEIIRTGGAVKSFMGELTQAHEGAPVAGDWVIGPVFYDDESTIHIFKVDSIEYDDDRKPQYISDDIVLSEGFDIEKSIAVEVNVHMHDKDKS